MRPQALFSQRKPAATNGCRVFLVVQRTDARGGAAGYLLHEFTAVLLLEARDVGLRNDAATLTFVIHYGHAPDKAAFEHVDAFFKGAFARDRDAGRAHASARRHDPQVFALSNGARHDVAIGD